MEVQVNIDEDIFLPCYRHLLESKTDIKFLWGGRDSGKSRDTAMRKVKDCLSFTYFREILIKKTFNSIKDSQWQTIKDVVEDWGLSHLFTFKTSPLEIDCVNGNKFIARGCDDPAKMKSIQNPSGAWIEEGNQLTEEDWIIILTSLRSNKGNIRVDMTFNPESDENDFEEFWLYKHFFKEYCEKGIYSFDGIYSIILPDETKIEFNYSSTHTTYHDNPYITPQRVAIHELLKQTNPYYYKVFTKGLWGRRISGGQIYKCYSSAKQIANIKLMPGFENKERLFPYNPTLAIHMTWDFNVNPYVTCNIWQGKGKWVGKIAEILLSYPRNTNLAVCDEFERMFPAQNSGLFIYGDPGGLKESTADETTVRVHEKDYNEFTKIVQRLSKYKPELRVPRAYPSVKPRVQFINTCFESTFEGIEIVFDETCKRSDAEYSNLKEASDGTKFKEMYRDENTNVQCQKWGHISDADDYFLTQYFSNEYHKFQTGSSSPTIIIGRNYSKNKW